MAIVTRGLYAGMDTAVLQQWRDAALQALNELQTGGRIQSATYSQGNFSQSVTKMPTTIEGLQTYIRQLNQVLGYCGRRAISMRYGG